MTNYAFKNNIKFYKDSNLKKFVNPVLLVLNVIADRSCMHNARLKLKCEPQNILSYIFSTKRGV
jgi:hypothetical protein